MEGIVLKVNIRNPSAGGCHFQTRVVWFGTQIQYVEICNMIPSSKRIYGHRRKANFNPKTSWQLPGQKETRRVIKNQL